MRLLLPMIVPVMAGVLVLTSAGMKKNRKWLAGTVTAALVLELALVFSAFGVEGAWTVWELTDTISISFQVDDIGRLFAALTCVVWLLAGIFSVPYMEHGHEEARFFGFFLIVEGVLAGLDFSSNLVTMYVFYELMTLTSLPLVLHERTKEAVMAGLKYLFYSVAGAFLALFGIFFLASVPGRLDFAAGGVLDASAVAGKEGLLLIAVCCMIVGFGAKAGMFPLHGWLPTAHPVAPAPASAVLSGVITKSGVLAMVRVVYYVVGPGMVRGTWVQQVWIALSLLTVFMGSMLAYKEQVFKKRLAYSTVSQVSYMLFGLGLLQPTAFVGALSHVVFHSVIKNCLFLVAGAVIVKTGWTRVGEMKGLGKLMPFTLGCYTIASLALVGIPPASGFISKWYLSTGALASGMGAWGVVGPAVLLISALLTAGYLLPVTVRGFFPGQEFDGSGLDARRAGFEIPWMMAVPVAALAAASLLLGCFPNGLVGMLERVAEAVL